MIAEIGHYALILALLASLAQAFFGLIGAARNHDAFIATVRPAVSVQFLMSSLALAVLIAAFVQNDFSVEYVAANSNSALPVGYRIAAVWGAHEGSLLLWAWILVAWTLAVALLSRSLPAA
ncbi:MAG: c-type cytochrome biogenesis protein CcmF, partial [Gammaproteobacteria bacterium]|nr:c-type cytochrome biogenesis protein CcmF [Gammaproteobacteria bacterium]